MAMARLIGPASVLGVGLAALCVAAYAPQARAGSGQSYLLFNQQLIESASATGLNLDSPDDVFRHIFSRLPDTVVVYPTENYYYFILFVAGREVRGNINLPARYRDQGILSFGYAEFDEFMLGPSKGVTGAKYFSQADGVVIHRVDRFTYTVTYNGKTVTFRLNQLPQEPPKRFRLGTEEVFVQRTLDESGYQFFLLFNEKSNSLFWVLNEEPGVPDTLEPAGEDLLVGRRSGFAFWVDKAHDDRKILLAVRRLNIMRNDYYDGPFDQLADNYADETKVAEYMKRAVPELRGRIDMYGYYTDSPRPARVALATYFTYFARSELTTIMKQVREHPDPYQHISRAGVPLPATERQVPRGATP